MTVDEIKSLGFDNTLLHDPYQYTHSYMPSLYQTHKDSGKWYFYLEGREIYVDRAKLDQLLVILKP